MSVHNREKTFKCDECGVAYARRYDLDSHIRVHTGELPYKCVECGASFRQEGHLQSHTRIHIRAHTHSNNVNEANSLTSTVTSCRKYACDQCSATFTRKYVLRNHMMVHSGERPYRCKDCGASFAQKCNMLAHTRIHTGLAPYKCELCDATFSLKSGLRSHKRTHISKKEYKCDMCPSAFARKSELNVHCHTHTPMKLHKCLECGQEFTKKSKAQRVSCGQRISKGTPIVALNTDKDDPCKCKCHTEWAQASRRQYKCKTCESTYSSKIDLKIHVCTRQSVDCVMASTKKSKVQDDIGRKAEAHTMSDSCITETCISDCATDWSKKEDLLYFNSDDFAYNCIIPLDCLSYDLDDTFGS